MSKNMKGYDEYIKQVPKHKRKPRTLEHPMTPDAEADIPNRRWLGLCKAWRKALHNYDPPDMACNPDMPTHKPVSVEHSSDLLLPRKPTKVLTAEEKQIHEARIKELPVTFSNTVHVSESASEMGSSASTCSDMPEDTKLDVSMNNESFLSCRWADVCDSDDDLL